MDCAMVTLTNSFKTVKWYNAILQKLLNSSIQPQFFSTISSNPLLERVYQQDRAKKNKIKKKTLCSFPASLLLLPAHSMVYHVVTS